jgi:hypothetical protein
MFVYVFVVFSLEEERVGFVRVFGKVRYLFESSI